MARIDVPKSVLVPKLQGLHLFHFDPAPCAQRVRFALAEKGLRRGREERWDADSPHSVRDEPGGWVSRHVSLIRKDHLTDNYAAIHPHMVVPALVHDGRLHIESMDIVRYIDETWPHNRLFPEDPAAAELADALVERGKKLHVSVRYVSFRWGLGRLGKIGVREEAFLRKLEQKESPEQLFAFYSRYNRDTIDQGTYDSHLRALEEGYGWLERLLESDGRPFLTGNTFSFADIIWSCKVLRISECGYPFRRNFPAVFAWYEHVSRRPAFRDGVMHGHHAMSKAFQFKAGLDNLFGRGLKQASSRTMHLSDRIPNV
jgi:glutathione S-transferase